MTTEQLTARIFGIEDALTARYLTHGPITDATEQADWADRVLNASFGRNTVIFDSDDRPHVMVRIPVGYLSDLNPSWPRIPHPAFWSDLEWTSNTVARDVYVGKYQASGDHHVVLRGVDARVSTNFDAFLSGFRAKGPGWSTMGNDIWAYLALWCHANGFHPRGNNNYGRDTDYQYEQGVPAHFANETQVGRVLTGSGPITWSHDGTPFGVFDLNGNVWEWVSGLRLDDGEYQICHPITGDHGVASSDWMAILQDGSLVAPETANTLKINTPAESDTNQSSAWIDTEIGFPIASSQISLPFQNLGAEVVVPDLMIQLGLYPPGGSLRSDRLYARSGDERLPFRGGLWTIGSVAGVFALDLNRPRSFSNTDRGARPACVI